MALVITACFLALVLVRVKCDSSHHDSNYVRGKDVMVHLFEWRWEDIATECEQFLSPMGYAGVQVSPPTENAIIKPQNGNVGPNRPWYERYQPVSYKLVSRSGNEDQFKEMVDRCNKVGVRIYVDVVINHMAGNLPSGTIGTDGSKFDCDARTFEGVPYGPNDFNSGSCPSQTGNIEDYSDNNQVRNCKLVGLNDLNQGMDYVRNKICEFLNHLLEIGVAGFRIDAAKHMWPGDLAIIYGGLNNLSSKYFDPFMQPLIYQEVIDLGSESVSSNEYVGLGRVTEFKYGMKLGVIFKGMDKLCYVKTFGEGWGFINSNDALVFIDNHDNQRGHGGGGHDILNFFTPDLYRKAVIFMLAWPYGLKRVMSSYSWVQDWQNEDDKNNWIGPPHDDSYNTLAIKINRNDTCSNGWVCEHRWPAVAQMVRLSIVSQNQPVVDWWDNANQQIAFSRGNKSFIAINNEYENMTSKIRTSLPAGQYCDILSGVYTFENCTGRIFTVPIDNMLLLNLPNGMMALHVQAMISNKSTAAGIENSKDLILGYKRTIVFIEIQNLDNFNLKTTAFIRGGLFPDRVADCIEYGYCSVPIDHMSVFSNWSVGDTKLDWNGKEDKQGEHNQLEAAGTPLFLSSNIKSSKNYMPENVYDDNLWTLDVMMDCTKSDSGWFEFKVFLPSMDDKPWETDISQETSCSGTYKAQLPFNSNNHLALCGKVNIFTYGEGCCEIHDI